VIWFWGVTATSTVVSVAVLAVTVHRVAIEATALRNAATNFARVAVAVDDLEHDARRVERTLARLAHR
jgi:hypothetical protein